jgi:hypothetical protein
MTLTDAAIDRIVKAVGTEPIGQPDAEDTFVGERPNSRGLLRADLESLASLYRTGSDVRKQHAKYREEIARALRRAESLKSDAAAILGIRFKRHRRALDRLIADLDGESRLALHPAFGVTDGSAFHNLVGRGLKNAFERHFKIEAGYTRDPINYGVTGAFIDFAQAALEEMNVTYLGRPYSRGSIANALSDVKKQIRA